MDARDYSTAFRVRPAPGKGLDELQVRSIVRPLVVSVDTICHLR